MEMGRHLEIRNEQNDGRTVCIPITRETGTTFIQALIHISKVPFDDPIVPVQWIGETGFTARFPDGMSKSNSLFHY